MKIRAIHMLCTGPGAYIRPGDEGEVPDELASVLIGRGAAELIGAAPVADAGVSVTQHDDSGVTVRQAAPTPQEPAPPAPRRTKKAES